MVKNYDRTACISCSSKIACEKLRNESQCHVCDESLTCLMSGDVNNKKCHKMKRLWRTLPRKCTLVDEIMCNYLTVSVNFRDNANFYVNNYNKKICPRCLQATFVMYGFKHSGQHRECYTVRYTQYCGDCPICNAYTIQPVIQKDKR